MTGDLADRCAAKLTGPVVADLAAEYTPGIAAMDARNAALALAAEAADAAQLRAWLEEVGLLDAPAHWQAQR